MPGSILGTSVRRVEDPELLRGAGTFINNMHPDGVGNLHFIRSPFAHARILSVDLDDARHAEGVIGVYVASDLGIPPHHAFFPLNKEVPRPPLAQGEAMFVGDAVVAILADTLVHAVDAAELMIVEYEELPVAIGPEQVLLEGAPLFSDAVPNNIASGYRSGDNGALDDAEIVVRARFYNQRIAVAPLEGNAILVDPTPDADGHHMTVWVSTQMPHMWGKLIAAIFEVEASTIRVIAPHVGGAFGGKAGITAEHSVAFRVAQISGRPVKWVESRSENMVAMPHGRSQVQYAELGLTGEGRITGLSLTTIGEAGAYGGFGGGLALGPSKSMAQGVYEIPKISYDSVATLTNTTPVGAFRGAGRPEAAELLERIMDIAADELDIDPVELRRRNLIANGTFPYLTRVGTTYDSGDYLAALDKAVEISQYPALLKEQQRRRESGDTVLMGIGVSTYVEITAGGGGTEFSSVTIDADGGATIRVGTSGHGQGHATSFAMIVSSELGIPMESIRFIQSDTAEVPRGGGTGGSRSLQVGGNAVRGASELVFEQAAKLAAARLEAAPEDIEIVEGGVAVRGVPTAKVEWSALHALSEAEGAALIGTFDFVQSGATFPFGAHVSVVEVDTETGLVRPIRHFAVDDCGRVLNPMIVQGQQHGGIAQGIAQVLWEEVTYDEAGNPGGTNFADYGIPSAAELPSYVTVNTETPTPLNALGAKGIGESGTIGAMPAVHNAVVDALSHLGVRHIEMPCTPQRVWSAIEAAKRGDNGIIWGDLPPVIATLPVQGARSDIDDMPDV